MLDARLFTMDSDVKTILEDAALSDQEKIEALMKMKTEAEGKMRAATEGGMVGSDDPGEELLEIDRALAVLGKEEDEPNGATL